MVDTADELFDDSYMEYELLNSLMPSPRLFLLNPMSGIGKSHMLGFLLEETEDSFLIALPGFLMESSDTGKREFSLYSDSRFLRVLKNSISLCMYPYGDFAKYYDEFLLKNTTKLYPTIGLLVKEYLEIDEFPGEAESEEAADKSLEETMADLQKEGKVVILPFNNKQ